MWAWLCLACLLPGWAERAHADDPALRWQTLETRHFIIHYHERLGDLPERVARFCEEAHVQLVPLLDWVPAEKTHVVLDDRVDTANGSALIVPRNTIRLFMTGPEARSSLGDYDDWLRGLIIHEYTHILHIDTISGLPAFLNELLGKRLSPNQLLPRWFTEGLATYEESARTSGGRVRSSLFHMYLRTAWLDGRFYDISQLGSSPFLWPRGTAAYLYGSHFLAYVAETRGEEFFRRFNHDYGGRYIPYSLNITARDASATATQAQGHDLIELYDEWKAHIARTYTAQLEPVRAAGVTPYEKITDHGLTANSPRPRPGHDQVTWYASTGEEQLGIYAQDLRTGDVSRLFRTPGGAGSHWWDPTGRYVVFHSSRFIRNTYIYNELILRDTVTGQQRALTHGRRARDPAFDPTGRVVVYVENAGGHTHLVSLDLARQERRVLVRTDTLGQFDTPAFSPDGRFVAVSYWPDRRGRDIYVYDLKHDRLVQLTADRALDLEPTFSPDGRHLLFSSDRSLIYDIYALDVSKLAESVDAMAARLPDTVLRLTGLPLFQVTRVERGLFTPQVIQQGDRQWLYVSTFGLDGFDIARMPFEPDGAFLGAAAPPVVRRPLVRYPEPPGPIVTSPPRRYAGGRYLAPRSISPLFAFNNGGRNSYGLEMSGFDPVGHHTWVFIGDYFQENESSLVLLSYGNNRLTTPFTLSLQHSTYLRDRVLVTGSAFEPFKEQSFDAQASITVPIRTPAETQNLSFGYNLRLTTPLGELPRADPEPGDLSPVDPEPRNLSSAFVTYFIGDTNRFANSVSAEEGFSLRLTLRFRDRLTLSDARSTRVTYSAALYQNNPWLDNHVFVARLRGGFERSDFRGRERFAIGGPPPQDVVTAVINELPLGGDFLRGFEPGTQRGEQFHILTGEYRFPVWIIQQGFGTLPVHLGRLTGAVFADYGSAFNGPLADARRFLGTGAELHLETTFGYAEPFIFRLGYAHGFGSEGIDDLYFFFGGGF